MAEQIKFGDRLFLTGEKLVLDNGASAGIIMSESGTIEIEGNLIVTGDTTTVNSLQTSFADPKLLINGDLTGAPTEDVGIEIGRGTSANKFLTWNETSDKWTVGSESFVAGTFEGNLTGDVTGDITSSGSTFSGIDINGGTIDGTPIGGTTPAAGNFTLITGDGTGLTNIFTNYDTDDLAEGSTNLFFTNERVDDRVDALFTSAYGITGTYNDAGDEFTLAFDPINAGSAIAVLDTTDTTQAKFRTIREGQVASGGHGDLTVALSGDEIVIDTTIPINHVAYNSYTGNGTISVYTLPYSVSQDWQVLVYIDGEVQHPVTNYAISGSTLTLTSSLGNGAVMNVIRMATNSVSSTITDATTLGGNLPAHFLDWAQTTGTPTTLAGYGITDGYANSDVDSHLNQSNPTSGYVLSWNGSDYTWIDNAGYTDSDFDTRFATKSTTNLSEGTNLYYTDARSRAAISVSGDLSYNSSTGVISSSGLASSTTDDLTEGSTNLYYTTARANTDFDTRLATKDTDDLTEGSLSLYYTDARVRAVSLEHIVEDTTPQLGGTLDLNTFDLTTTDPTVSLTTTLTPTTAQGTVAATTDTNLSNVTIAFTDDNANVANATSAYTTLTSTQITNLGFKGEISLTYFGAAAPTSNFVWRDVSDSAEQNDMISVYSPPSDEYTFTLPHETGFQIDSTDADIYFKQYAYGEMTVTTTSPLTGSNIQLRDANGFYIDKDHVTVTNISGNDYKIVFWTHDVSAGDVIDVVSPSAQTAIFEWGTESFSEPGFALTSEGFSVTSSTNDIFALGDLEITTGSTTGEVVGWAVYDHPTNNAIISGLTTVTIDGTGYQTALTTTEVPILMTGNAGTSNELSIAVGGPLTTVADARLWLIDSSGDLIYKFPAADGTANQVMKTDGAGDISWATQNTDDVTEGSTNLYYTDARADARAQLKIDALVGGASAAFDTLVEIENAMATDTELTNAIAALNHDSLSGFVANEHIDWTSASAGTIHASNYTDTNTDTTYTAGTNVTISGSNVISATDTNTTYVDSDWNHDNLTGFVANEHIDWTSASAGTIHASNYTNTGDTTYTASGTGLTLVGTVFSNTAPDQTVSLTGTGATTVTGTYPNFTIDSTNTTTSITGDIIPATDNTYDLGSSAKKYANIYGHSVHATYADLAERYATDVPYESGTVVILGGEAEITVTSEARDVAVAGVISTNPAVKLNADAGNSETHPYVALRGRVPCKMIGPVSKGDLIVTADNEPGYAQSIGKENAGRSVFAKSIETDLTEGKRLIEVVIL